MPRQSKRVIYYVALPSGGNCQMTVTTRDDGAIKVVASPQHGRKETGLERLERHALQAIENQQVDGIQDYGDGDYIVPAGWMLPNGSRPDPGYEVTFTLTHATCTCDYGEANQGSPCAHLGAVYAMMLLDPLRYAEMIDAVHRSYGRLVDPEPVLEESADVLEIFRRTREDPDKAYADLFG